MISETPPSPELNKTDTFDARKREIENLNMMKMSTLERVNKENSLKIEILQQHLHWTSEEIHAAWFTIQDWERLLNEYEFKLQ